MEVQKKEKYVLQWHPAFYAGIQIEFAGEAENLVFENEHQLGTKPKEIDILIIKKEEKLPLQTNIGGIFRKHNIVEYKSPNDYLSIDDFYRVYGYACFYKSDAERINGISIEDITLTFVCHNNPKSLVRHWKQERNYRLERKDEGIYYVIGDKIPIQLILTSQLSEEKNFWLKNLTNRIEEKETAEKLIEAYEKNKNSRLHKSVMDIIVRANKGAFEEVKGMCDALRELMQDEIDKAVKEGIEKGLQERLQQGMQEGIQQGMQEGIQQGMREGLQQGMREGLQQGIQEGIQQGIKSVVETCQELGLSKEDTLIRVKNKFSLEQEAAENSLVKYWKENVA